MRPIMKRKPAPLTYRLLSAVIAFTFSFTSVVPPSYAQSIASLNLPVPGAMISPSAAFVPVLLKGMTIHPDNPLQFDFIIDSGNTDFKEDQIKSESERLVKYFLASMTLPKNDLWVNLSPYEKDRIIPDELGKTELGRDMLAQDYILKQLTASLMYPEKELGKEFWDKVYKQAQEKFGTTEIPVNTFNKVWILPETATVYEHGQTVYIVEARLRVMLDEDYQAREASLVKSEAQDKSRYASRDTRYGSEIIREIILPEIEREVNEGQNFAPLRQIYHSLILAKWYKETIKNSLLSKVYVDKKLINGIRLEDGQLKGKDGSIIDSQSSIVDQIYNQYMEAYKKGVFNYIKEDYDQLSAQPIPRKYFSGGIDRLMNVDLKTINVENAPKASIPIIRSAGRTFIALALATCLGAGCAPTYHNLKGANSQEMLQALRDGNPKAGWVIITNQEVTEEAAKAMLEGVMKRNPSFFGITRNEIPLDKFREDFFKKVNGKEFIDTLVKNGSPAAKKLLMLYRTSFFREGFVSDKALHEFVGAKRDYYKMTDSQHQLFPLATMLSDFFPEEGKHFEMPDRFANPEIIESFYYLEEMKPGEVKDFIPFIVRVNGSHSNTYASEEAVEILHDLRLIELAQRSVVVKLLVQRNDLALPKSRRVEFRWSKYPTVKITYPSVYWTHEDIFRLKKLLNNDYYGKAARKTLIELEVQNKKLQNFESVLAAFQSRELEIYNRALIMIALKNQYQEKFLPYAAKFLHEEANFTSDNSNYEKYKSVTNILVNIGESTFNILYEAAKDQNTPFYYREILIPQLERIHSRFFLAPPGAGLAY